MEVQHHGHGGDEGGREVGEEKEHGHVRHSSFKHKLRRKPDNAVRWLLAGIALLLALLVITDVVETRFNNNQVVWEEYYMRAVVRNPENWHLGWRLQDLAQQVAYQRDRIFTLLHIVDKVPPLTTPLMKRVGTGTMKGAREGGLGRGDGGGSGGAASVGGAEIPHEISLAKVFSAEEDLNRLVSVSCAARPGKFLQVGMHSMVASKDDACKVFSAAVEPLGPHSMFEKIDLGEGQFALRAFSNGRFLRVNPPAQGEDDEVWFLEVGAPEVGLPEIFRMRDGMVYSDVMRGYLSCSGEGSEAELKGFVGEWLWQSPDHYVLIFQKVLEVAIERARMLRDLSNIVHAAQSRAREAYITQQRGVIIESQESTTKGKNPATSPETMETIALCIPMTSHGTLMNDTSDSPLWQHPLQTFLSITDWHNPTFRYRWYLGFDRGDEVYDEPHAQSRLREDFFGHAMEEFGMQGIEENHASRLLNDVLLLNLMYFEDFQNAPSRVVSALIQQAYQDGCDYFYQINDDSVMNTPGWAETLTGVLRNNPLGTNVGVTGPTDTNNVRILTHAFVHRTHLEIFGRFFPYSFMNWWSDDWISNVYGTDHTLRNHRVTVTHDVRSQKTGSNNRYVIDYLAQARLLFELQAGHVKLSKWLTVHQMPPPALPMVCGYAPLVEKIEQEVFARWIADHQPTKEGKEERGQKVGAEAAPGAGPQSPGEMKAQKTRRSERRERGDSEPADTGDDWDSPDTKRQQTTSDEMIVAVPAPQLPQPVVDEVATQSLRAPRHSESAVEDNRDGALGIPTIQTTKVDRATTMNQRVVVGGEGELERKIGKESNKPAKAATTGTERKSVSRSETAEQELQKKVAEAIRAVDEIEKDEEVAGEHNQGDAAVAST